MKKLMIAAAIVCAVAVSQAASIKWGGDIAQADGTNPVGTGSVAYLIRGASTAAAAVTTITVDGTDWSAWTTDTGAKIVAAHTLTADQAGTNYHFEDSYNISGTDDAGYYSVVVVDGQAGADGLKGSYNYAGQNTVTSATDPTVVKLTVGDNWATSAAWLGDGGFTAVSFAAAGGTGGVPEPTSGLLLLLGVAGLALKRKVA